MVIMAIKPFKLKKTPSLPLRKPKLRNLLPQHMLLAELPSVGPLQGPQEWLVEILYI